MYYNSMCYIKHPMYEHMIGIGIWNIKNHGNANHENVVFGNAEK